jgi:hypothetical protein
LDDFLNCWVWKVRTPHKNAGCCFGRVASVHDGSFFREHHRCLSFLITCVFFSNFNRHFETQTKQQTHNSTYPALGHENDNPTNCIFITFICSLESFLGVLYSGFCGAILFGKVLRIQSHAQVIFSDPIVIRYGSGVQQGADQDGALDDEKDGPKRLPCPVLEFRVINRLFGETGGEIMDATCE